MSKSRTNIKADIALKISGTIDSTTLASLINQAAEDVLDSVDTMSTKRVVDLVSRLFDNVYEYPAPTDLKSDCIVDIIPQNIYRNRFDNWRLTTPEEFDRYKTDGRYLGNDKGYLDYVSGKENLVSISSNMLGRTLLISSLLGGDDTVIDPINDADDWNEFGDGDNLTTDTTQYVSGNASVNFDISAAGGTTAGIYRDDIDDFDITTLLNDGVEFVSFYITDTTDITNLKIRIGSSSSDYYEMTATTKNDGTAFTNGWNLVRFDWSGATETGSVDLDACDYVAIFMTKDAGKVSESNYRLNYLVGGVGERIKVAYYSNYPWKTAAGALLSASTADTDILQAEGEEYSLFMDKLCELCELWLRNQDLFDKWTKRFNENVATYKLIHPSERMTSTQVYWDFNNYDY